MSPTLKLSCGLLAAALGVSLAHADNHALLLGISTYPNAPLPGVTKDMESGREIARLIGVPELNIVVKKDAELTRERFPQVIEEFSRKIKQGDRIFVYYSGHGTSFSKRDQPGQCEKALVTQEEQVFLKDDFHKLMNKLAIRTDKTFVFLDSCFSGGLVQATHSKSMGRDMGTRPRPKFTSSKPSDICAKASNYSAKSSRDFGMESAPATPNYYLLASSAENQYAIDGGEEIGGYATSALLGCLKNPRRTDANGDGVVTLDEARLCAQGAVDERLKQWKQSDPEFPYTSMTLSHGYGPGGNPAISFVDGNQTVNTGSFIQTLYEGRDATRKVTLRSDKNPVRIGDYLNLELNSDRPGYVTLMVVGSSGKIYQIFPNQLDGEARIDAGRAIAIPRLDKWKMPATPPAGDNQFLVLISDTPDRFKGLGEQAGIFKGLGNTAHSAKGIIERILQPAAGCASASAARDFGMEAVNPCSTGYGAALIKVTEVD